LNAEYDASEDTNTDILDEISDLEDELNELKEKIDVYNIIPTGSHYSMTTFEVINGGLDGREYAVGDDNETQESCEEYVDQLIDDIGYGGFSKGFAEGFIDEDKVVDWARDFYESDIYDSPDAYFDESQRELSKKQLENIEILDEKIEKAKELISKLEDYRDEQEEDEEGDEDKIQEIDDKIEELNDFISDYETEIEEINDNPDGEYPNDLIEEAVESRLEDVRYDPVSFMKEWGLEFDDFIDRTEFIKGVIDADGYGGTLGTYDGNADDVTVEGKTYWVIRLN
jgi:hypothetical protein